MTLNNSASMVALGNLNKNVKKVGTTLAKIASGDRIPTAKYDSAGLAMSEILREQLRSLHQDQQNVQNGSSLFKTASGGIDDIISNIRRLKELAINSANDSNSDIDRATIQKEVDASLATIEDIAVGTEYNGRKLLDGTFAPSEYSRTSHGLTDPHAEPTGTPTMITGSTTISSDGVYQLDESLGTATITVTASNVKIIGASSAKDASIVVKNPASLWLENYKATVTSDKNLIDFQTGDNFLHLKGNNELKNEGNYSHGVPKKAAIFTGGTNLTIFGEENTGTAGSLKIELAQYVMGACIGSNGNYTNPSNSDYSNINILSGTFDLVHRGHSGAAIGSGCGSSIGNITIYDGKIDMNVYNCDVTIGADGGHSSFSPRVGLITVNGGDINAIMTSNMVENAIISDYAFGHGDHATVDSIAFNGGKIHVENQGNGTAIRPGYNLPGTFSDDEKIYDQDLPNVFGNLIASDSNNLAIHHGTKSNQMDLFYIDSMRPKAMKLEKLDVTTRDKSTAAIDKIDKALEYALDVATDVGSYMERLEFTESNLEIKSENTALSDSVLRDADMAKEMTEYTKFNVLTQSAQAMLAQAGQNQSQVLSLLQ